jgi:hypothetical protein
MSPRAWTIALAVLVALVYGGVAFEIARAEFQLVNDYRPFAMSRMEVWPEHMAETLLDLTRDGAWLYRPYPDAMEWMFSTWFRNHPGAWHLLVFTLRLITVFYGFRIAREYASAPAATAAAAYLAFFPAVPEINLLRAENWLMPLMAMTFFGWIGFEKGTHRSYSTAVAFVLATLAKEIMAPLLALLLVLLARHYWRRRIVGRVLLAVMSVALAYQSAHFLLMFADPYGSASTALFSNAYWVVKVTLLPTLTFPLFSLVLLLYFLAGARRLAATLRDDATRVQAIGLAILFLASIGMAIVAPYQAIRYVYPAALFAVPLLGLGMDELGRIAGVPTRDVLAGATAIVLAVFGGTALWAQAASMRASSRADWDLLRFLAAGLAAGRDVVVIDDADFERSFWMRAELVGVDPRWPFLSHVARRYAAGQSVVWPPPPAGPVNLTNTARASESRGRFFLVPKQFDFERVAYDAIVVQANPHDGSSPTTPQSLTIMGLGQFDHRHSGSALALERFHALARLINGRHRFGNDLGETAFPGHYWVVYRRSSG